MAGRIADEGRQEFDRMAGELDATLRSRLDGVDGLAQRRLEALEARVAALENAAAAVANREADALGEPLRD